MANAEREPITGIWERIPQWGPEGHGRGPLRAENITAFDTQRKQQIRLVLRILQSGESSSKHVRL